MERYLQYGLTSVIIIMLLLNVIPALKAYQISKSIRSESPGGSSLPERYLILGDWPSSVQFPDQITKHYNYKITPKKK
ncbi:hypothetical protein [Aliamphritea ceti]|uniref:hypothetical protein n=1 Tax=Aliamphritea ceti TaxID=1524258 RepID=UPI0021C26D2F|nr:hypothetical protein [Aliamphritea ceti]